MTPAGIEPATFRFVAQHLNHCAPIFVKCLGDLYLTSLLHQQFLKGPKEKYF